MNNKNYQHHHSAHCESGVMSLMMRHCGLELSEAMVFGLSGTLNFAFIPFVKMGGMPLIAYRSIPKSIIRGFKRFPGIKMKMLKFASPKKGTQALDRLIGNGHIVGAQTSAYWLPYFPEDMRFHFNAHNLIVYDKVGDDYLVSDPVFEHTVRCDVKSLEKARFVKGLMAPKGFLYYPLSVPSSIDLERIIPASIKKTAKKMLKTPVPIAGIRAVYALAKFIGNLDKKDKRYARLFLGHIVRMQEEIGTGGAGFRFIYASYLQEAAGILDSAKLREASSLMTNVGDQWREFAMLTVQNIRNGKLDKSELGELKTKLEEVAGAEAGVYKLLLEGNDYRS